MEALSSFLPENIVNAFGWTLLHSIWQGAVAAMLLGTAFIFMRKAEAKTRYNLAFVTLLLLVAVSVFTFVANYEKVVVIKNSYPTKAYVAEKTSPSDGMIYLSLNDKNEKTSKVLFAEYLKDFKITLPQICP